MGGSQLSHRLLQAALIGRRITVTSAAAALIGLSVLNSMHGPAYDCVRAGAYFLRSRRGPILALMSVEQAAWREPVFAEFDYRYGTKVTLSSRLSARP